MAYLLGEAAIRISGNAQGLQRDIKSAVEDAKNQKQQVEVPIVADLDEFDRSVKHVDEEADRLRREEVDIPVYFDVNKASYEAAKEKILALDEKDAKVDVWFDVHQDHADDAVQDFIDKWDGSNKSKIGIDMVIASNPRDLEENFQAGLRASSAAFRSSVNKDSRFWLDKQMNVLNVWSKVWGRMNDGISHGLLNMYTPYYDMFTKLADVMSHPVLNYKEFKDKAAAPDSAINSWKEIGNEVKNFGISAKYALFYAEDGNTRLSNAFKDLKASLADRGVFRTLGTTMTAPFKQAADGARTLRANWQSFKGGFEGLQAPPIIDGMLKKAERLRYSMWWSLQPLRESPRTAFRVAEDAAKSSFSHISMFSKVARFDIQDMFSGLKEGAGRTMFKAGDKIIAGLDGVSHRFGARGKVMAAGLVNKMAGSLARGFANMSSLASTAAKSTATTFKLAFGGIADAGHKLKDVFGGVFGKMTDFAKTAATKTGGLFSKAFSGIGKFASKQMSRLGNNVHVVYSGLTKAFGPVVGIAGEFLGSALGKKLKDGAGKAFKMVGRYASAFGNIAMGSFAKVAGVLQSSLQPAIMSVVAGLGAMAGQAMIGSIIALGGAIGSVAAGAAVMLPALGAAAGLSFAPLMVGLGDVKKAASAAFSAKTPEDFEKALEGMSPAAADIARNLREIQPGLQMLGDQMKTNLLTGLGPSMAKALGSLTVASTSGLLKISTAWNASFKNLFEELGSDRASTGMSTIAENVAKMAQNMQPVMANLAAGFGSLAEQGSKFLVGFGSGLSDVTTKFAVWAESLKEVDSDGLSKFDKIIESAKTNAGYLMDIFGGLGSTIFHVFSAGAESGQAMLGGMAKGMQDLATYTSQGNEGFEKLTTFVQNASSFASQLGALVRPIFDIVMAVSATLTGLGTGALPGIVTLVQGISSGLSGLPTIAESFGKSIGDALGKFGPIIQQILPALFPVLSAIGQALGTVLGGIADALAPITDNFKNLAAAFAPVLTTVGTALSQIFQAMSPYLASTMNILTQLMGPLNQIFGWIGKIAAKALEVLGPIFLNHDSALQVLLASLGPVIDIIGGGIMAVLTALQPALQTLGDAFGRIMEAVAPLIDAIGNALKMAFTVLVDVINWVSPFLPGLTDLFVMLVKGGVQLVVDIFNFLVGLVQAIWPLISSIISVAINNVIVPVFNFLVGVIKVLGAIFSWLHDYIVVPVFTGIKDIISVVFSWIEWAVNNVVKPVLEVLGKAFEIAKDAIKTAWDSLKKVFADPISWFIDVVVNKGVVDTWNSVMDWLKVDDKKMNPVENQIKGFSRGGIVPGANTRGRDNRIYRDQDGNLLGLSGGEGIMRQEFVSAVGGRRGIDQLNEDARHGRLGLPKKTQKIRQQYNINPDIDRQLAHEHGYARGGVYAPTPRENAQLGGAAINRSLLIALKTAFPKAILTAGMTDHANDGGYHPRGAAIDVVGPMQQMANWIFKTYPGSAQLIYGPGPVILNSAINGRIPNADQAAIRAAYTPATMAQHYDHVHWASDGVITSDGQMVSDAAGSAGGFSIIDWAQKAVDWVQEHVVAKIMDPITNTFGEKLKQWGNYGNMAVGFAKNAIDTTVNTVKEKAKSMANSVFGGGDSGSVDLSGVSGDVAAQVEQVFARHGWTGQAWEDAKWIIGKESGFNPSAVNPSSGAYGLFQFLGGTKDTYLPGPDYSVPTQADAGARYIKDRYGSPAAARRWWESHHWYDQGGIANGVGHMLKNTLQPERVLSPVQTKAFNDFVYSYMPQLIDNFRKNPRDILRVGEILGRKLDSINKEIRKGHLEWFGNEAYKMFRAREAGKPIQNKLTDLPKGLLEMPKSIQDLQDKVSKGQGWYNENAPKLQQNFNGAVANARMVTYDPLAYLEAEQAAIDRMNKEDEERKKKEEEEKRKAEEEQRKKDQEAESDANKKANEERNERKKAEKEEVDARKKAALEGVKDDSEKEAIRKKFEEEKEAIDKKYQEEKDAISERRKDEKEAQKEKDKAEQDAIKEREKKEDERIAKLKESGEYYYGYKVRNKDKDPKHEQSWQEKMGRSVTGSIATALGLGDAFNGINDQVTAFQDLGAQIEVVAPSWWAAANGDYAGLNHNIAVAGAKTNAQNQEALDNLLPGAAAGIVEMSNAAAVQPQYSPFIENLYTGASGAELNEALNHYEGVQARRSGGTIRTR